MRSQAASTDNFYSLISFRVFHELADSFRPVLLRSGNPHIIGRRDLGIFYIGCDSHPL
jgi:hypothetical protein